MSRAAHLEVIPEAEFQHVKCRNPTFSWSGIVSERGQCRRYPAMQAGRSDHPTAQTHAKNSRHLRHLCHLRHLRHLRFLRPTVFVRKMGTLARLLLRSSVNDSALKNATAESGHPPDAISSTSLISLNSRSGMRSVLQKAVLFPKGDTQHSRKRQRVPSVCQPELARHNSLGR